MTSEPPLAPKRAAISAAAAITSFGVYGSIGIPTDL